MGNLGDDNMSDATLIESIKTIVGEYIDATDQCTFLYGTVMSASPLSIYINEKLTIAEDFLVKTRNVTDYELEIDIEDKNTWKTETADAHTHEIKGKKKLKVLNALKQGEKVVLIRQQGGQKYLVLDRCKGVKYDTAEQ